jgi:hypothetical protein
VKRGCSGKYRVGGIEKGRQSKQHITGEDREKKRYMNSGLSGVADMGSFREGLGCKNYKQSCH